MFQVKWRYEIRASAKLEFLGVYDRKGKWYDFFSKSRNYVGSNLTEESDNIFLLVDTWKSREAYYEFIKDNENEYKELSNKYSRLYLKEERTVDSET